MFWILFCKFNVTLPSVHCQNCSRCVDKKTNIERLGSKKFGLLFLIKIIHFDIILLCIYVWLKRIMRIQISLASGHCQWLNTTNIHPDCLLITLLQGPCIIRPDSAYKQTNTSGIHEITPWFNICSCDRSSFMQAIWWTTLCVCVCAGEWANVRVCRWGWQRDIGSISSISLK